MKYLDIVREKRAKLATERSALFAELEAIPEIAIMEKRDLSDEETGLADEVRSKIAALDTEDDTLKAREAELAAIAERAATSAHVPQVVRKDKPADVLEDRAASPRALADALVRSVEERLGEGSELDSVRSMVRRHGDSDPAWTRSLIARSTKEYESAFMNLLRSKGEMGMLDPSDQQVLRAVAIGTNTQGGFFVPTVIDPTLVYTNSGTSNAIRQVARVITLTGAANAYNPISTAGVTASWDAELTEVSDDAPALTRGAIPIYKAQAFVPYSFEAEEDIPGLEQELRFALQDAKDRLEATAHATGSGSGQPTGLFTALNADTNTQVVTTTAATVGLADLHALYRALPVRWRSNGTFVANPLWLGAIRQLGSAVGASFSGDLRDPLPERLIGRPIVESDDAPSTQTTTALDNIMAFGDMRNYVILDKPGSMQVEFIQNVVSGANGRPIGARALYAHWRNGANVVTTNAFRLLVDKTSA
jgi:HK97 family phage major capsid protein